LSDVWLIKHYNWIDAGITAHHSVSDLQAFQERIFIAEQQLPDSSLLSESSKADLDSDKPDKVF
jgi:hypothetical protein